MGDPVRALELEVILNEIQEKKLVENTAITGKYLLTGLEELQVGLLLFLLLSVF